MEEDAWESAEGEIKDMHERGMELNTALTDLALLFRTAQEKAATARIGAANRKRYADLKQSTNFKTRGVCNALANLGSRMLKMAGAALEESQILTETSSPWDAGVFAFYGKHAGITSMVTLIEKSVASEQQDLQDKLAAPSGKGMRGLFHQCGLDEDLPALDIVAASDLSDSGETNFLGFKPCIVSIRSFTLRVGNSSFPWWAQGCWIIARSGDLVVCSVNLTKIEEKKTMSSLDDFEAVMGDRKVSRLDWPVAILHPGECVYCPFGEVPLVTSDSDVASFLVLPWVTRIGLKADPHLQELIFTAFAKWLKTVEKKTAWQPLVGKWKAYRASSNDE